ncbi:hypothetical protein AU696_25365, partial [Salmonella enterica subsp. enterica serovar Stanley]|nr:hypothetical protein [Salmonella enterica subsp. enterica serovar Stanley]
FTQQLLIKMRLILIDRAIGTIRETKTRKIHAGRENSVIRRLSGARECIGQNQTGADDVKNTG